MRHYLKSELKFKTCFLTDMKIEWRLLLMILHAAINFRRQITLSWLYILINFKPILLQKPETTQPTW